MTAAPGTLLEITEADILKFAPKAKREYVTAILGKLSALRQSGILESQLRWCHFMGQCGAETGGFRVIRESLTYTTVAQIRKTWPARFKTWSDADIKAKLIRNPVALGDAVYAGRMGNHAPGDGYAFRGGGCGQVTGRAAVIRYCKTLGLDPSPALLDDCNVTTDFFILEWLQAKCNEFADENDIMKVSRAINVGSSTSGVMPVGMDARREWFAKAWSVWGDKGKADMPKNPMTVEHAVKVGVPTATIGIPVGVEVVDQVKGAIGAVATHGVPAIPEVASKSLEHIAAWKAFVRGFAGLGSELFGVAKAFGHMWPYVLVAGMAGGALAYLKLRQRHEPHS